MSDVRRKLLWLGFLFGLTIMLMCAVVLIARQQERWVKDTMARQDREHEVVRQAFPNCSVHYAFAGYNDMFTVICIREEGFQTFEVEIEETNIVSVKETYQPRR